MLLAGSRANLGLSNLCFSFISGQETTWMKDLTADSMFMKVYEILLYGEIRLLDKRIF